MKQWLKKYKDWQSRGQVRALVRWERTRAKGKSRFILDLGWRYCLIMIPAAAYGRYFSEGTMYSWLSASFWIEAVRYFVTGAFIAYLTWGSMESKYNNARLGSSATPTNHQLGI